MGKLFMREVVWSDGRGYGGDGCGGLHNCEVCFRWRSQLKGEEVEWFRVVLWRG